MLGLLKYKRLAPGSRVWRRSHDPRRKTLPAPSVAVAKPALRRYPRTAPLWRSTASPASASFVQITSESATRTLGPKLP